MPKQFPTTIHLSDLNGINGYKLQGETAGDHAGFSLGAGGDINGDIYNDILIGAHYYANFTGRGYVVYGSNQTVLGGIFNLTNLNGVRGFKIDGEVMGDYSSHAISSAGDVNGDNYDDILIGAPYRTSATGRSYVIYGGNPIISGGVLNLTSLNGVTGFKMNGESAGDVSGWSVSGAGDINADGYDDILVGAHYHAGIGRSYLIYGGNRTISGGLLNLSSLNGTTGFKINGEATGDFSGYSVSAAGDINRDGHYDFMIGAFGHAGATGRSYVLYGNNQTINGGLLNLSSISGVIGFKLDGETAGDSSGCPINAAGDIDGDGYGDILIGAANHANGNGRSYLVYGSNQKILGGVLNLTNLNGMSGFKLDGEVGRSGISVSTAGDINADGYADILIGADYYANVAGRCYVVFGSAIRGTGGILPLSDLDGSNGFKIDGEESYSYSGSSASGAGDINGDSIDDLLIGAQGFSDNTGRAYVIFGDISPLILRNQLSLRQGQSVLVTNDHLNATDNAPIVFNITNIQHGRFELVSNPGLSLTLFNQSQVSAQQVRFVHDNSTFAPSYFVQVPNAGIALTPPPQAANITFYRAPSWLNNQLTIQEGGVVTLNSAMLDVQDDYPDSQVIFNVSSQHGQFEWIPGNITSTQFTRQQIRAGQIRFRHDGGELAPSYEVSMTDGYFDLSASTSNITYLSINDPPAIVNNQLALLQSETINITTSELQVTDSDTPAANLTFYINNLQHGIFHSLPQGRSVNSFSMQNISNGDIQFIDDGTPFPPYYQVTATDGEFSVGPQSPVVTFNGVNLAPVFANNNLNIAEGQTVTLSTNYLNALDTDTPVDRITFIVDNVQHGQFERFASSGLAITSFSLQEVQQNMIRFVHDDSESAPSYMLSVTDGNSVVGPRAAVISYTPINDPPVLISNQLTIAEGETLTLDLADISATDRDSSSESLTFTVSGVQQGRFELTSSPSIAISSFSQEAVNSSLVRFVHDGGELAPSYSVTVDDGLLSTLPKAAQINFTNVDDAPIIRSNQLIAKEGEAVALTASQLEVFDVDTPADEVSITPSNIQHGNFERVFNPGVAISTFSKQDLEFGFIRFSHDGDEIAPDYQIIASDGTLSTAPSTALISFTQVNDAPLLEKNQLTITEGETLVFKSAELLATDPDNSVDDLIFTVTNVQHGQFVAGSQNETVVSFSQKNISEGDIRFIHDASDEAPSYLTTVSDGQLTTTPQSAIIHFTAVNDPPTLEVNTLTITQDQSVILTPQYLSASDEETPAKELIFTVDQLQHGHFEYVTTGTKITVFSQEKIASADIRFVHDGSLHAPNYTVSVSDGELFTEPSTPVIQFTEDSEKYARSDDGITRAIIAAVVSGSIGFLFLATRLIVSYKVNQRLQSALMKGQMQSDTQALRTEFYKNVIHPIAEKIFARIKTTGFLGYRNEQDTHRYLDAIIQLVTRLGELGVDLEMQGQSADKHLHLYNEIAKQTRQVLMPAHGYCSKAYCSSFFKAEVTPQQFEDNVESIAQAIFTGYKHKNQSAGAKIEMVDLQDDKERAIPVESQSSYSPRLLSQRQRSSSLEQRLGKIEEGLKDLDQLKNAVEELRQEQVKFSKSS